MLQVGSNYQSQIWKEPLNIRKQLWKSYGQVLRWDLLMWHGLPGFLGGKGLAG